MPGSPTQELDKLRDAAVAARLPAEREAWLNLAFYLDEQYVEWVDKTSTIRRIPKKTPDEPRPIVNKIMHFTQQERAMVLQAKPIADVLPATDDIVDISKTSIANAYIRYVSEPVNANFSRRLSRATLWAIICGSAYLKWVWDPDKNQPAVIPCSIFEVASDPYVTDFSDARYIIHSKFMALDEANEKFPGANLKPGKEERADPMRVELLRGMGCAPVLNGITVNEIWYRPCKKYPDGMYTVWANRQILRAQDNLPYHHKRLPFTFLGCIERPDSQWWHSPIKYLRSGQMELNQYHAQRVTIRKKFSNPKWWIPEELELKELPNEAPDQVLQGASNNGMLKPEIIQPAVFPDGQDGAMIEEQMMHIVGLHEVSQAQVPGRVEAAKAIEMLKESDADRQQTMLETISSSISEGWYQVLLLAKQFETPGKLLRTYSREGMPEIQRFMHDAIDPGMSVQITMGTGLARSRAARQDQLMNMWSVGIITDPEQMAELMEVPIPTFTAPRLLDIRLARNENLILAKNQAIVPNSWDDHTLHLREHNNYRKTQEYLTADTSVKLKFEHHCQLHENMQMDQLQRQQAILALTGPPQAATPQRQLTPTATQG